MKKLFSKVTAAMIALLALLAIPQKAMAQAREAYAVLDDTGTFTFYYDGQKATRTGTVYDMPAAGSDPAWKENIEPKRAVFDASFADYRPTSLKKWFQFCSALTGIEGIENLNTSEVTDMQKMFYGCRSLQRLNLTGFNTAKVTDMRSMFYECHKLQNLDLSSWNTAKVTNMNSMFYDCPVLQNLNLTGWNTSEVTDMGNMFDGCSVLQSLDLTSFNTAKVTDMRSMFEVCFELTTIICNNTWTCSNSSKMFNYCVKLKGAVAYDATKKGIEMANPETGYFTLGGKIPASGYSTLKLGANKGTMQGDVEIFTGVIDGDKLKLKKRDDKNLPAEAAVLVKGNPGEVFTLAVDNSLTPSAMPTNDITGNVAPYTVKADDHILALATIDDVMAFYRVDTGVTIPAHKAWLNLPSGAGAKVLTIEFEDVATGISAIDAAPALNNRAAYNLAGQRVGNDYKGIVIVGGRKILQ